MQEDKKQKLLEIIRNAELPEEIKNEFLGKIENQSEVNDDFILQIADELEKTGVYMKTVGEIQNEFLDQVAEAASKVNDSMSVLDSLANNLENPDEASTTNQ